MQAHTARGFGANSSNITIFIPVIKPGIIILINFFIIVAVVVLFTVK